MCVNVCMHAYIHTFISNLYIAVSYVNDLLLFQSITKVPDTNITISDFVCLCTIDNSSV